MDDFAKALSTTWPFFLIGAVALAAVFALLRTSLAGLKTMLDALRQEQQALHAQVSELDRRVDAASQQHTALGERIELAEREFEVHRIATSESLLAAASRAVTDADSSETVVCPAESLDRFNAAADALSQVAKELEGFDSRQAENWLRIKGDLEEQAFALRRVQQHVDQLSAPPEAVAHTYQPAAASAD